MNIFHNILASQLVIKYSYSNLLTVVHIGYNGENGDAQRFEISKLKQLGKLWNPPEVIKIWDPSNLEHNTITVSKLVQNWSTWTQISYSFRNSKSASTNVKQEPDGLMTKMITFIKPKGRKQYMWCFLQYQILRGQNVINYDEYCCHVKQVILASANSYCNFHIFFIYCVLYFPVWTSKLYFPYFLLFAFESRYCPFKRFVLNS